MRLLPEPIRFEWDAGNSLKNQALHGVSNQEAEEAYFGSDAFILDDPEHSTVEKRYVLLGETRAGRRLTAVFTLRHDRVRVISARDMSRKERRGYAAVKKNPTV